MSAAIPLSGVAAERSAHAALRAAARSYREQGAICPVRDPATATFVGACELR